MQRPVVLALDLARRTGWAVGRAYDRHPDLRAGTWLLPTIAGGSLGPCMSALADRLTRAINEWDVEHVCYESPLPPASQSTVLTSRWLMGLPAVVEMVCYECDVPVSEGNLASARKFVLGFGAIRHDRKAANPEKARRDARAKMKQLVQEWAASRGLDMLDDNAADAALMHHYAAVLLTGDAHGVRQPALRV